jgi:hypothetical protein
MERERETTTTTTTTLSELGGETERKAVTIHKPKNVCHGRIESIDPTTSVFGVNTTKIRKRSSKTRIFV